MDLPWPAKNIHHRISGRTTGWDLPYLSQDLSLFKDQTGLHCRQDSLLPLEPILNTYRKSLSAQSICLSLGGPIKSIKEV